MSKNPYLTAVQPQIEKSVAPPVTPIIQAGSKPGLQFSQIKFMALKAGLILVVLVVVAGSLIQFGKKTPSQSAEIAVEAVPASAVVSAPDMASAPVAAPVEAVLSPSVQAELNLEREQLSKAQADLSEYESCIQHRKTGVKCGN